MLARTFSPPALTWPRLRALVACALVAGLVGAGCSPNRLRRSLKTVGEVSTVDRRSPYLKVHAKDGELYVLSEWRIDEAGRQISGRGERLNLAREIDRQRSAHRLAR